jgi:hypothetical protein
MSQDNASARVRIKSRRKSNHAEGGYLYEIAPLRYDGPWEFAEDTVLEVVEEPETPKEECNL